MTTVQLALVNPPTTAAAAAGYAAALVAFLTGLLDEHDRLTGHTAHPVTTDDLRTIAANVGAPR